MKNIILKGLCLVGAFLPQVSFSQEVQPCSERYEQAESFDVTAGKSWKQSLKDWGILKQWGFSDRLTLLENGVRIFFPEGSINPANRKAPRGGVGGYLSKGFGSGRQAACLAYDVTFDEGFAFARGGKLPGLYGGKPSHGCRKGAGKDGFSTRYMWRKDGIGTLYAYVPSRKKACGDLIAFDAWRFEGGKTVNLEQEIVLNEADKENGIMRIWVDGKQVYNDEQATLRVSDDITIDGIMFHSFFGGKDESWASPKDQSLEIQNMVVAFP